MVITSHSFSLAGSTRLNSGLKELTMRALATNSLVPTARWKLASGLSSAAYGSFVSVAQQNLDRVVF